MGNKYELYESWANEEIKSSLAVYENDKGRLSLRKLPSSTMADVWFWVILALMVAICLVSIGVFSGFNELWGEPHIMTLAYLEAYPTFFLFLIGLHVIGYRYEELRKYGAMKKALKVRNRQEKNHGKAHYSNSTS